jgi:hypothetical protein
MQGAQGVESALRASNPDAICRARSGASRQCSPATKTCRRGPANSVHPNRNHCGCVDTAHEKTVPAPVLRAEKELLYCLRLF